MTSGLVFMAVLPQSGVIRLELLEDTNSALDVCVLGTWRNIQIRIQSRRSSSLLKTDGHVAPVQDQFSVCPRANHTTYPGSLSLTQRDAAKTAPSSPLRSHTMDSATNRQNYGCLLWFAYFCLKCWWNCWKFKWISRMLQFC